MDASRTHLATAQRLDGGNVTGAYARALQAGDLKDAAAVRELAQKLLRRPALFATIRAGRRADT